jgi:TatD DNase family protein
MFRSDAHNHLHDPRLGAPEPVITTMRAAGITRCVVNATCEEDWPVIETLFAQHPDFILPAFGIHPWKAHLAATGWQDRLHCILEKHPSASVGECGLDRWIDHPALPIQSPVFEAQLALARELGRCAVIHCLKAWQPLFDSFDRIQPPARLLLHSFSGSIETARRLIPLGAYFSFSGHFLHPRKAAIIETFRQLPPDRILIETDAPDMLPPDQFITYPLLAGQNHPANLPAIASAFATHLNLDPLDLSTRQEHNFERCFSYSTPISRPI